MNEDIEFGYGVIADDVMRLDGHWYLVERETQQYHRVIYDD